MLKHGTVTAPTHSLSFRKPEDFDVDETSLIGGVILRILEPRTGHWEFRVEKINLDYVLTILKPVVNPRSVPISQMASQDEMVRLLAYLPQEGAVLS